MLAVCSILKFLDRRPRVVTLLGDQELGSADHENLRGRGPCSAGDDRTCMAATTVSRPITGRLTCCLPGQNAWPQATRRPFACVPSVSAASSSRTRRGPDRTFWWRLGTALLSSRDPPSSACRRRRQTQPPS